MREKQSATPAQEDYMRRRQHRRLLILIMRLFLFLAFLIIWELGARLSWIDSFIFSSPSRVIRTLVWMTLHENLMLHLWATLYETLISFSLVTALSLAISVLLWRFFTLSSILEPYLVILNSLPKSALAPLLIVWLGSNQTTIITAGMSVAIFGSIINLYTGFRETDEEKLKLIYTFGGTRNDALQKVILPSSIPLLLSVMKVNIGLCLVGIIIGEFISSRQGLGYLIIYGSQVYKLDWVITSIVILCLLAMVLYGILNFAEHRCRRSSQGTD